MILTGHVDPTPALLQRFQLFAQRSVGCVQLSILGLQLLSILVENGEMFFSVTLHGAYTERPYQEAECHQENEALNSSWRESLQERSVPCFCG